MKGTIYLSVGESMMNQARYYSRAQRSRLIDLFHKQGSKHRLYAITIRPDEQLESTIVKQAQMDGYYQKYMWLLGNSEYAGFRPVGLLE